VFFKSSRIFALSFFALLIAVPSLVVILGTFKTTLEVSESPLAIPQSFALTNYRELLSGGELFRNFSNSLYVTLFSVSITLLLASFAAYAISRMVTISGKILFVLFAIGLAIPGQVNIVPVYQLFNQLGLLNSLNGLILINVTTTLPISIFILTTFFRQLPKEMFEVSSIDGAGPFRVYRSIALPLSRPAMGATSIFLFVINWNDLLYPLLLITQSDKKTLPLAMLDYKGEYFTNFNMIFTAVIVASVPMVVMYLFMQRSFVAGLTAGAVKG